MGSPSYMNPHLRVMSARFCVYFISLSARMVQPPVCIGLAVYAVGHSSLILGHQLRQEIRRRTALEASGRPAYGGTATLAVDITD